MIFYYKDLSEYLVFAKGNYHITKSVVYHKNRNFIKIPHFFLICNPQPPHRDICMCI